MRLSDPSDLPNARMHFLPWVEENARDVNHAPLIEPLLSRWTPAISDQAYKREPRPTASVWHGAEYARTEQ